MKKQITIKPLTGLDNLKFGVTKSEVEKLFGSPPETEIIEDDEEPDAEVWNYEEMDLSVFFEDDYDELLTCFDISDEDAVLFEKRVFDLTKDQIIDLMKENGFKDHESDDEEWGEHRLSYNDAVMDFYFDNGKLTSVSWGVMIDEDNKAKFP